MATNNLEIYKECIEQTLAQSHAFSIQIPQEKFTRYNRELISSLNIGKKEAKNILKTAKEKNKSKFWPKAYEIFGTH